MRKRFELIWRIRNTTRKLCVWKLKYNAYKLEIPLTIEAIFAFYACQSVNSITFDHRISMQNDCVRFESIWAWTIWLLIKWLRNRFIMKINVKCRTNARSKCTHEQQPKWTKTRLMWTQIESFFRIITNFKSLHIQLAHAVAACVGLWFTTALRRPALPFATKYLNYIW